MHALIFPARGAANFPHGLHRTGRSVISFLFLLLALATSFIFLGDAWAGKPPGVGGGKPPPSDPPPELILPVSLGAPAECQSSEGTGLNNGSYPGSLVVTTFTFGCASQYNRPYSWHDGYWDDLGTLPGAVGGNSNGVSDDGTVVGFLAGSIGIAFVVEEGGDMHALPLLDGMEHAGAQGISANGEYAYGDNQHSQSAWAAVRWKREIGSWSVEDMDVVGQAAGACDDGSVIAGNSGYGSGGWVWMDDGSVQDLGTNSVARDIDPECTMIVGFRWASCGANCSYEVPVYWMLSDTGWGQPIDLPALDGVDSEALGVGMVNGKLVIVGYGHTRKDGIMRAVAWVPESGVYSKITRLEALGGKSKAWASARDVNSQGLVVGTSQSNGPGRLAVLWTLPAQ